MTGMAEISGDRRCITRAKHRHVAAGYRAGSFTRRFAFGLSHPPIFRQIGYGGGHKPALASSVACAAMFGRNSTFTRRIASS